MNGTSRYAELVRDCLFQFTPWETPCAVPERFDPLTETIDQLNFQGRLADEEHEVEVNRIHATLHPDCFARLVAANEFATPDERLELPQFFISDGHDDTNSSSRRPPDLSEHDLNTINDLLAHEASRRKASSATLFRVLVDGRERAEIANGQSTTASFRVDDNAELIEVYGDDGEGQLLLATHLLNFTRGAEPASVITLENGQQISFTTKLLVDEAGLTTGADLVVSCKETALLRAAGLDIRRMLGSFSGSAAGQPMAMAWWKPAAGLVALALLIGGVWWSWFRVRPEPRQPDQQLVFVPTPAPTSVPVATPNQSPAQQNAIDRKQPTPSVKQSPQPDFSTTAPQIAQREVKPERDESFVERSIVADSGDAGVSESGVRGWNREVMGKPLGEVRRVYLQNGANNTQAQALLAELRAKLGGGGTLQLAESDAADAALKISVRAASSRADERRVIAIVRAVNANGYVVWPATRRSMRYVGQPYYVAQRMMVDLTKAVESAR